MSKAIKVERLGNLTTADDFNYQKKLASLANNAPSTIESKILKALYEIKDLFQRNRIYGLTIQLSETEIIKVAFWKTKGRTMRLIKAIFPNGKIINFPYERKLGFNNLKVVVRTIPLIKRDNINPKFTGTQYEGEIKELE